MLRRRALALVGTAATGGFAGCLGGDDCGPGDDTLADVAARVEDTDETFIDADFEAEVVSITDLDRLVVDDTTAEAELYTAGGFEFSDSVSEGECYEGRGNAIAKDNENSDRLVVQVSSLEETSWL